MTTTISLTFGAMTATKTITAADLQRVVDASTTFLAAAAGGGANNVPVVCDGTSWKIG